MDSQSHTRSEFFISFRMFCYLKWKYLHFSQITGADLSQKWHLNLYFSSTRLPHGFRGSSQKMCAHDFKKTLGFHSRTSLQRTKFKRLFWHLPENLKACGVHMPKSWTVSVSLKTRFPDGSIQPKFRNSRARRCCWDCGKRCSNQPIRELGCLGAGLPRTWVLFFNFRKFSQIKTINIPNERCFIFLWKKKIL